MGPPSSSFPSLWPHAGAGPALRGWVGGSACSGGSPSPGPAAFRAAARAAGLLRAPPGARRVPTPPPPGGHRARPLGSPQPRFGASRAPSPAPFCSEPEGVPSPAPRSACPHCVSAWSVRSAPWGGSRHATCEYRAAAGGCGDVPDPVFFFLLCPATVPKPPGISCSLLLALLRAVPGQGAGCSWPGELPQPWGHHPWPRCLPQGAPCPVGSWPARLLALVWGSGAWARCSPGTGRADLGLEGSGLGSDGAPVPSHPREMLPLLQRAHGPPLRLPERPRLHRLVQGSPPRTLHRHPGRGCGGLPVRGRAFLGV